MAYCVNCGAKLGDGANFCPSCGTAVNGNNQSTQNQSSDAAKTAATIAGTALGVSILSNMMRRRRHRMMPPPHRGPMGGPRGPMGGIGGPGGRGPGGRGPGGRGPRGGGFGRP